MKRLGTLLAIGLVLAPVSAFAAKAKSAAAKVYWCQRFPDEMLRDTAGNLTAVRYYYLRFTQTGSTKAVTMFEVTQTGKTNNVRTMEFGFARMSEGNEVYSLTAARGTTMEVAFVKNLPTDQFHPVKPGVYGDSCVVKARTLGEHDLLGGFQRLVPADYPVFK